MKGFINVIKPSGMSSAYAVGAVKKKFNCPCGHMGTLDPMASGVLPVGLHKTSRLFDYLLDKTKRYIATFKFGVLTDTLDSTGNVIATSSVIPSKEQIQSKLTDFVGEISQIPPKYSAKCIDGKRGYELARKGVDFTLAPKIVTILDFKLTKQISDNEFEFTIDCKGGTYIRSLARDLGSSLGSMAIMTSLIRAKSGFFSLENGVISFSGDGSAYSPCDGIVESVEKSQNGIYSITVAHSENFKTVIDGLTHIYVNNGDKVMSKIPVGYFYDNTASMCFMSGDTILTGFTLNDSLVVWAV